VLIKFPIQSYRALYRLIHFCIKPLARKHDEGSISRLDTSMIFRAADDSSLPPSLPPDDSTSSSRFPILPRSSHFGSEPQDREARVEGEENPDIRGSSKCSIMSGSRCEVAGHTVMNCFAPRGQTGLAEPSVRDRTRVRGPQQFRGLIRRTVPMGIRRAIPLRHEESVKKPGDLWWSISQTAMAD